MSEKWLRSTIRIVPVTLMICFTIGISPAQSEDREIYHCRDTWDRMTLSDRPCQEGMVFVEMKTITVHEPVSRQNASVIKKLDQPKTKDLTSVPEIAKRSTLKKQEDCKKTDDGPWLNTFEPEDCG